MGGARCARVEAFLSRYLYSANPALGQVATEKGRDPYTPVQHRRRPPPLDPGVRADFRERPRLSNPLIPDIVFPMPSQSIYDFILATRDQAGGEYLDLPDEPPRDKNAIRFSGGSLDGVVG